MKLAIRVSRTFTAGYDNLRIDILYRDPRWYTKDSVHGYNVQGSISYQSHAGSPEWYGQNFHMNYGHTDNLLYMAKVANFLSQDKSLEFLLKHSTEFEYLDGAWIPKNKNGCDLYRISNTNGFLGFVPVMPKESVLINIKKSGITDNCVSIELAYHHVNLDYANYDLDRTEELKLLIK